MASKLNSEFNYRYQVIGETVWEKIKTLKGFLEGRIRAAALEKVANLKLLALRSELDNAISVNALPHVVMRLQAELLELESHLPSQEEAFELNRQEIKILENLLAEYFLIAEPTRIPGYTDEQMFEANAMNEYTVSLGREIQAEIISCGRASPAKIKNAMNCPQTFHALKLAGLIPDGAKLLGANNDPLCIELKPV